MFWELGSLKFEQWQGSGGGKLTRGRECYHTRNKFQSFFKSQKIVSIFNRFGMFWCSTSSIWHVWRSTSWSPNSYSQNSSNPDWTTNGDQELSEKLKRRRELHQTQILLVLFAISAKVLTNLCVKRRCSLPCCSRVADVRRELLYEDFWWFGFSICCEFFNFCH